MTKKTNTLTINAIKYELIKKHEGTRTIQIQKSQESKYMDSVLREYTNKGYTIVECTAHTTTLRSECKRFLIVLTNS